MNIKYLKVTVLMLTLLLLVSCSSRKMTLEEMKLRTVDRVNLDEFMGKWYVIANIPTFVEKDAVNAIEYYELRPDGDVDITFTLHRKSPQNPEKKYSARGYVQDTSSSAYWKVQFIWPLKFDYLVLDVADDYSHTVIGVPNQKYVWIMAREPSIAENRYESIITKLERQGYETSKIKKVPQIWEDLSK